MNDELCKVCAGWPVDEDSLRGLCYRCWEDERCPGVLVGFQCGNEPESKFSSSGLCRFCFWSASRDYNSPDAILRREEFNAGRRRMQARGVRSDDPGQWWGYGPSIG